MKVKAKTIILKAKADEVTVKAIRAEKRVNLKIKTLKIIFIIKESYKRCASTKIKKAKVIKNLVNMLFAKRLCNIRANKKTFFVLFQTRAMRFKSRCYENCYKLILLQIILIIINTR